MARRAPRSPAAPPRCGPSRSAPPSRDPLRAPRPRPSCCGDTPRGSPPWSTCPRRWGPAARTSHRARYRTTDRRRPHGPNTLSAGSAPAPRSRSWHPRFRGAASMAGPFIRFGSPIGGCRGSSHRCDRSREAHGERSWLPCQSRSVRRSDGPGVSAHPFGDGSATPHTGGIRRDAGEQDRHDELSYPVIDRDVEQERRRCEADSDEQEKPRLALGSDDVELCAPLRNAMG